MATMPRLPDPRQTGPSQADRSDWFASGSGRQLLESEAMAVQQALDERPGQPWLWLSPILLSPAPGRGLHLRVTATGWSGPVRCALPLPLANESVATALVQHVPGIAAAAALLSECERVLVPGGRLWLFALNPLSPYRWRWQGSGPSAIEPMFWRRRLRKAGLTPEPISQGVGPRWRIESSPELQHGPGLRAAYLLRAEKRRLPLTPVRQRAPLRIGGGVPAA
jgi:SAM-dependent methyltransferase